MSYRQIFNKTAANPIKLFTLGLMPSLFRNVLLCAAFVPQFTGINYEPLLAVYSLGAILISHPFEVARTII